ncbi:MAG: hypothetical protein JW718_02180 [Desulfovibrionaceae bacterium]|nr:hypothetical protein [Desulfovibrionaceae bacterium]
MRDPALNTPGPWPQALDLPFAAGLCLALFCLAHFWGLGGPYLVNDDVRQQLFWMLEWRDPGLFSGDLLADYARRYVPWGVQGVYWSACLVMGPLAFSRLLPGLLFTATGLGLFLIGRELSGRALAWSALVVFALMPVFLFNMAGGLARGFAAPLLVLFVLSFMRGSAWGMGLCLVLQALFIPYMFALCAACCGLAWAWALFRGRSPVFLARARHFAVLVLCCVLVWLWSADLVRSGYGPLVSASDMVGRPEFSDLGRFPLWPGASILRTFVIEPFEWLGPFHELGPVGGAAGCVLILLLAGLGARRADWSWPPRARQALLFLALGSIALYVLARVFALRLFVPSRYVEYSLTLFLCLFLAGCLNGLLRGLWSRTFSAVFLAIAALVLGAFRLHGVGLYDYSADQALYRALQKTPKNSLVAGHPRLMDNVLAFGQRPVLASFELAHPWSAGLWRQIEPRLNETFEAYYAKDRQTIVEFCRRRGVDYLVVDERDFDPEFMRKGAFFAPFDQRIRALAEGGGGFALLSERDFPGPRLGGLRLVDARGLVQARAK